MARRGGEGPAPPPSAPPRGRPRPPGYITGGPRRGPPASLLSGSVTVRAVSGHGEGHRVGTRLGGPWGGAHAPQPRGCGTLPRGSTWGCGPVGDGSSRVQDHPPFPLHGAAEHSHGPGKALGCGGHGTLCATGGGGPRCVPVPPPGSLPLRGGTRRGAPRGPGSHEGPGHVPTVPLGTPRAGGGCAPRGVWGCRGGGDDTLLPPPPWGRRAWVGVSPGGGGRW